MSNAFLGFMDGAAGASRDLVSGCLGAAFPAGLVDVRWPTVLGMGLFALGGAAIGYFSVKLVWRLRILIKRRRHR